jgi:hypothetical protein
MCDCERPATMMTRMRRARVAHRCCECFRTIAPGAVYEYVSWVWEGRGASFKTCEECAAIRQWYVHECLRPSDCWPCFGGLIEDATDCGREGTRAGLLVAAEQNGYLEMRGVS